MNDNLDLRVRRTLHLIHEAFYKLVLEKDFNEISVSELSSEAGINRKTFYLHYNSLEDLLDEIAEEIAAEIIDKINSDSQNLNLEGCIRTFYNYLENCSDVQKRLLCDDSYGFFYSNVTAIILQSEAFMRFIKRTRYPEICRSFATSITVMYRDWLNGGRQIPLERLVVYASRLLSKGYEGVTEK